MFTDCYFAEEARNEMKKGVDILANAVKVTLGPRGRNVIIRDQSPGAAPTITKDGVTVARTINLKDKVQDMGAQIIKGAAVKTAAVAGDGTTTATILAQEIITLGMVDVARGLNPMGLKKGIDKAVAVAVDELKKISTKVDGDVQKIKNIATISANNDPELGELIAKAMDEAGSNAYITMADSKTEETTVEVTQGLQIDKGYISPHFINSDKKPVVEFENALILIYDKKMSVFKDVENILNLAIRSKQPLVIIADDIDGEALQTLITNKVNNKKDFVAIKIPGSGSEIRDFMEDIAIVTGGKLVSEELGVKLETIDKSYFGCAKKITITKTTTTIFGPKGKKDAIDARIDLIESLIADCKNDFLKERLKVRKARISNGMGIIYVGAATDVERNEKKYRIDDALCAVRAAIEEGVVPGGGTAYLRCIQALQILEGLDEAENAGIAIIKSVMETPLRQILLNAGIVGKENQDKIEKLKFATPNTGFGYNAKSEEFEDLVASGIIDPLKVSRAALENAASVAGMFLTTECVISDI